MQNQSFSLRPATSDDLIRIVEIEKRVHVAPWTQEHFQSELDKPYSQTWLMTDDESDEVVAAYLVIWRMDDEVQILNVAVDLAYRGLGFAQEMLRKCMSLAIKSGAKRISLDVRKSNHAAIQLYQKMNFSITHVRKSFYSNGEDGYQMTLMLNGDSNMVE